MFILTPRKRKLINLIVREFVRSAEPVSSKALVKSGPFSLSSATIRNEMNELERAGFLAHRHTSGGRVPTNQSYRFYVDNLMASPGIYAPEATRKKVHKAIKEAGDDPQELNKVVANLVSALTDNIVVTNIEDSDYFYKTGLSSMFEFPEFREFDRVFNVANVFDHFEKMFNDIEQEFFSGGNDITIYIGEEGPIKDIKDETVILAKYPLPGRKTGSMTVIGPTRMDYEKNIGLIRCVVDEIKSKIKQIPL
jgi:transcriptional regulator of heat shock response